MNNNIRVHCRTCSAIVECQSDNLKLLTWIDGYHHNHEVWLIEPGTIDDYQVRLSEHIEKIINEQNLLRSEPRKGISSGVQLL